jgi:hypothetical protein
LHSPDGDWYWNGTAWIPARSPDRAWWWDGARWVPSGVAAPAGYEYRPTVWTRRLQLIFVGLTVLGLVVAAFAIPSFMAQTLQASMDRSLAQQAATDPASAAQVRQMMGGIMTGALVLAAVLTAALYVVVLVGIWKLWRWIYWYLVVTGLIAGLGVLQNLVYLLGAAPYPFPSWFLGYGIASGLVWTALAIWMIVLYRRHGTWARDRVPVSVGSRPGP